MATKQKKCPFCGGSMVFEALKETYEYRGQMRDTTLTGWWCKVCGDGILDGPEMLRDEQSFQEFKAEVDGVVGPTFIALVRKHLKLSQRKAGEVLGARERSRSTRPGLSKARMVTSAFPCETCKNIRGKGKPSLESDGCVKAG